jgi:hypothetical protein
LKTKHYEYYNNTVRVPYFGDADFFFVLTDKKRCLDLTVIAEEQKARSDSNGRIRTVKSNRARKIRR